MANVRIDDLALAGAVVAGMQLETDIGGVTSNKITVPQLMTYVNANLTSAGIDSAGAVLEADFNAQTVLVAVLDDTPVATVIADSEFVGRPAGGNLGAMTAAQARTVLNVANGATAGGGNWTTQIYTAGVDYTAGVTNTLPLPIDALVEENLLVFFDGVVQLEDMWSITTGGSPSVDFAAPIPVGTLKVGVRVFNRA